MNAAARYCCPACGGRLRGDAGPDWQVRVWCEACVWSDLLDPAADEFLHDLPRRDDGGEQR